MATYSAFTVAITCTSDDAATRQHTSTSLESLALIARKTDELPFDAQMHGFLAVPPVPLILLPVS